MYVCTWCYTYVHGSGCPGLPTSSMRVPDGVCAQEQRAAVKRMNVLARRWQAGTYRPADKAVLKGSSSQLT